MIMIGGIYIKLKKYLFFSLILVGVLVYQPKEVYHGSISYSYKRSPGLVGAVLEGLYLPDDTIITSCNNVNGTTAGIYLFFK